MNNSLTSPVEAALKMFEACITETPLTGRVESIDFKRDENTELCIYWMHLWIDTETSNDLVYVSCHVRHTDDGWTDGFIRVQAHTAEPEGWCFFYDMASTNPVPRPCRVSL